MPATHTKTGNDSEAPRVTVIGGANVDILGKSAAPLKVDDSNPGSVTVSAGGVGRNVAENLARLGVACRLLSVVGDDDHGRLLLRLTREAGVDVSAVHVTTAAPTSTYLGAIDANGEMKVAISDMRIADCLTPERLQDHDALLRSSTALVLDTNLPEETLDWIFRAYDDLPIFVDTVSTTKALRIKNHLGAINTLQANTLEAEALTGLEARTLPQLQQIAEQLHAAGVDVVFVTRGRSGVFYSDGAEQGSIAPDAEGATARNTTGAGDAFLAGFVRARLDNLGLSEAARFALARSQEKLL